MIKLNFIVVGVCCAALLAGFAFAIPSMEAKFIDAQIMPHSTAYINLKFSGIDFSHPITLGPAHPNQGDDKLATLWSFEDSSEDDDLQHVEELYAYKKNTCYDTTTRQVVATVEIHDDTITIRPALLAHVLLDAIPRSQVEMMKWDINCPVGIDTKVIPTALNLELTASNASTKLPPVTTALPMPSSGFGTPIIDFNSASIKQEPDDPYSSTEIEIEFTSNAGGVYCVNVPDSLVPDPSNHNTGGWADLFCSSGSDKQFARIAYGEETICLAAKPTQHAINCKFLFANHEDDDDRVQNLSGQLVIQLSLGKLVITRSVDYKAHPAVGIAQLEKGDGQRYQLRIESTPLEASSTPLKNNSTVVLKFSAQFSLDSLTLDQSSGSGVPYQTNTNCFGKSKRGRGFLATATVDKNKNSVTLADVSVRQGDSLYCIFEFLENPLKPQDRAAELSTVQILIDNKNIASRFTKGGQIPIYASSIGSFDPTFGQHVETEVEGKIVVNDTFAFSNHHSEKKSIMSDPILNVAIYGAQLFNMEEYPSQVTCEATSPSQTKFEKLNLQFNKEMLTWSAPLDHLANVEAYSIMIRCTRTVPIMKKYGWDITPLSSLDVAVVNLLEGKRFVDASSESHSMQPRVQAEPAPGLIPQQLPISVSTGCIEAEYMLPKVDQKSIDAAVNQFKEQTHKHIGTLAPGWIVSISTVDTSVAPFPNGKYYLSGLAPVEYATFMNADAHDLKSYYTGSLKIFDNDGGEQQEFFTRTNNPALQRMFNAFYNTDYVTVAIKECYEFQKDPSAGTPGEAYPTFSMTDDELKTNLQKGSSTGEYLKVPIIEYKLGKEEYFGYLDDNSRTPSSQSGTIGCGLDAIHFAVNHPPGTQVQWKDLHAPTTPLCSLGESCTYNADCDSGSCQGKRCIGEMTYNPPFVSLARATKAMGMEYLNSAPSFSFLVVGLLALISMIVLGC